MPSTNATPPASFQRGRSAFLRGTGSALPIASRTIRRWTFSFFATPAIVPMPNSYSLRISSNSSTFVLQSNEFLRSGHTPDQGYPFVERVGQNKLPKWASSEYRNHLHVLLGDEAVLAAEARIYQRLLAMDDQEARGVAEIYLNQNSLAQLYDSVIIPALT